MISRRAAWILVAGCGLLLAALAVWLVPWGWGPQESVRATDVFSISELERAASYRDRIRLLSWSSLALSTVVAVALGLVGHRLVPRLPRRWRALLTVMLWQLVFLVLALPFLLGIRRERLEQGLTHQSLSGWWQDRALTFAVGLVMPVVGVLALMWLARKAPRWWFAWAAGGAAALTFAASFLYPLLIEPLYNDFTSMPAGAQRTELLELADREGVPVSDVLVADASRRTTTLNAYVSGLGSSRRLVVYDTLLDTLPPDQVESVVAHELGHVKHHDVLLGTSLGALGAAGGVVLLALVIDSGAVRRRTGGPADARVVPVVLALVAVGSLMASPAFNAVSRAIEARADQSALAATRDPQAFEELQRSLAVRSLDDPAGPRWSQWWFGSHPTVLQRIGLARAWESER